MRGLCNETPATTSQIFNRHGVLEARVRLMSSDNDGHVALIPRISYSIHQERGLAITKQKRIPGLSHIDYDYQHSPRPNSAILWESTIVTSLSPLASCIMPCCVRRPKFEMRFHYQTCTYATLCECDILLGPVMRFHLIYQPILFLYPQTHISL